jgi:hypothetical protein
MSTPILRTTAFLSRSRFHSSGFRSIFSLQNQQGCQQFPSMKFFSSLPAFQGRSEDNVDLQSLTIPSLKSILKEKGLKVSGNKSDLLARLQTQPSQRNFSSEPEYEMRTSTSMERENLGGGTTKKKEEVSMAKKNSDKITSPILSASKAAEDDLKDMKISDLKALLKEKQLNTSGKKSELIARLKLFQMDIEKTSPNVVFNKKNSSKVVSNTHEDSSDVESDSEEDDEEPIEKMNFLDLSFSEFNILLQQWGHASYRAKQVGGLMIDIFLFPVTLKKKKSCINM